MLERLKDQGPIYNVGTRPIPRRTRPMVRTGNTPISRTTGKWWLKTGGVWVVNSPPPVVGDAPSDSAVYGRRNAAWAKAVQLAGDQMTGTLAIAPASGNASINLARCGVGNNDINGQTAAGSNRWLIRPGNSVAESGSNVGSDFNIISFTDAGAVLDHGTDRQTI